MGSTAHKKQQASLWRGLLGALVIAGTCTLGGCAADRVDHADAVAVPAGLLRTQVKTDGFVLTAYTKTSDSTLPYDVYIEGDGMAWLSPTEPSVNPTPRKALGLALAAQDPAANVIYIARPCQFTPRRLDPLCKTAYWTDRRFSEEVITSVNQAIDRLTAKSLNRKLNLVGYSGGGAVAVLVAARRNDVVSIRTVAGNLDHVEATRLHSATPLTGSLNAIDQARKVAPIPQIHFSGLHDDVIPPAIAEKFLAASAPTGCVALRTIDGATHEDGWIEKWPMLLKLRPECQFSVLPK